MKPDPSLTSAICSQDISAVVMSRSIPVVPCDKSGDMLQSRLLMIYIIYVLQHSLQVYRDLRLGDCRVCRARRVSVATRTFGLRQGPKE